MSPSRLLPAALLALSAILPGAARAQTADGSPAAPAPPGLAGAPSPGIRSAPGGRMRAGRFGSTLPAAKQTPPPKPTAAELAERRKLDHDLKICIGC